MNNLPTLPVINRSEWKAGDDDARKTLCSISSVLGGREHVICRTEETFDVDWLREGQFGHAKQIVVIARQEQRFRWITKEFAQSKNVTILCLEDGLNFDQVKERFVRYGIIEDSTVVAAD